MRCFLAVPVEEPALGEARALLERLRVEVQGVRWVRPDALHLTVHFFGSIADEAVRTGLRAVKPVADQLPQFTMRLERLAAFPERGRSRVLWLGSREEAPTLSTLALACRAALHRAGFEVDERPFTPHCTLGRPRSPWLPEHRDSWRSLAAAMQPLSAFTASRLVLYESQHATGGNVYVERASFPFATAGAAAG